MAVKSFPFPARNPRYPNTEDVICVAVSIRDNPALYATLYERSTGDEAKLLRFQYLSLEEELERSFQYVTPAIENADAYSINFADIIRAAAGTYEVLCRTLYARFYNDSDKINIFNYLALERFLRVRLRQVVCTAALDSLGQRRECLQPFVRQSTWDGNSEVRREHVPGWWDAYSSIKHSVEGMRQHATLTHAAAATAAVFLVIEQFFGLGVLTGGFINPPGQPNIFQSTPRWSRLFSAARDVSPSTP